MKPLQFTSEIYRLEYLLNVHYIEVPKNIVDATGGIGKMRLVCEVNNTLSFKCGLVALADGKAYITLNNARCKKLGVKEGSPVEIVLIKDESEFGMDMPEELAELFNQDEEGVARFRKLTPAMQRYIIFYVSQVKSSNKRIERALLLIENLKRLPDNGKETFREMLGLEKK
ncbi:MAG: YdeI/OmpD-associated family protein [Bacteroidetes bacterium]|nr:YdeI/OmpD-associated family protein [Bacteroidota bacterium]